MAPTCMTISSILHLLLWCGAIYTVYMAGSTILPEYILLFGILTTLFPVFGPSVVLCLIYMEIGHTRNRTLQSCEWRLPGFQSRY